MWPFIDRLCNLKGSIVQTKFLEREVRKPDRPEPDITRNKLRKGKCIKIEKLSQPRIILYPGQEENTNTHHQIGEPRKTMMISVSKEADSE